MNVPVGLVDLFDFDPYHLRAGVGVLIARNEDRRKGYATEALKVLISYAFEVLQLNQLYANVSASNTASLRLFQNLGFTKVGVKKDWLKTLSNGRK